MSRALRRGRSTLLLALTLLTLASLELHAEESAPSGGIAPTGVDEVIIRSRRTSERLEETPLAVTLITPQMIENASLRQLDDVQKLVPNLFWATGEYGTDSQVSIRGIGRANSDLQFDPGVGIYVDGVLMSRNFGALLPLMNVSGIEVLRGPQGTLFGKNTVGGAIAISTEKPGRDFAAHAMTGFGSYRRVTTELSLDLPVKAGWFEDKLFTRVAIGSDTDEGYVENVVLGTRASDRGVLATLASLRFLPRENLALDLNGSWSRDHTHSRGGKCRQEQDPPPIVAILNGPLAEMPIELQRFCAEAEARGTFTTSANIFGLADIESYGVWGTLEWRPEIDPPLVDDLALRVISAWREQRPRVRRDIDQTATDATHISELGGEASFFASELWGDNRQRQFTLELQLQNTAWNGNLRQTTGAYFFWDQADQWQELVFAGGQIGGLEDGPKALVEALGLGATRPALAFRRIDNFDRAVFHQTILDPVEWASLTGGVRFTIETKELAITQHRMVLPLGLPDSGAFIEQDVRDEVTFEEWTPMASLLLRTPRRWLERIPAIGLEELNPYLSYAAGFKGGGFNALVGSNDDNIILPFDPETLDSVEVGVKGRVAESRVRFAIDYFFEKYRDIQVTSISTVDDGDPMTVDTNVTNLTENAAAATVQGIELELTVEPVDALTLTGSFSWLDAVFDDFSDAVCPFSAQAGALFTDNCVTRPPSGDPMADPANFIDRSGERFASVPEFQANLAAEFRFDVEAAGARRGRGDMLLRIDWHYESGYFLQGPESPLHQPAFHLLDARVVYTFNNDRTSVSLWGKNLTDETYFRTGVQLINTLGISVRYFEPPRWFGIELAHDF